MPAKPQNYYGSGEEATNAGGNVFLDSDRYFNRPEKFTEMEGHIIPVDINGAAVPRDKDDRQNIADAQASIRKRFDLGR